MKDFNNYHHIDWRSPDEKEYNTFKPSDEGGGGGGSGIFTTDKMLINFFRDFFLNRNGSVGALFSMVDRLKAAGWKDPVNDKARFEHWTTLVDKVPELLNLYAQSRSVFIPVTGVYYLGQQEPFTNKIKININEMGSILNYAFTIGHEMLHVFDDKYNFQKFMSFFSTDSQDFKRDRYTIPVYMLFKEYRSYNWEREMGNDVNVADKLEQYRIMWALPQKTLEYLNSKIKIFSNAFINP